MKRLAPGVYDDEAGGLHIEIGELLVANGYADNAENRAQFERVWREWAAEHGTPITFTEKPVA